MKISDFNRLSPEEQIKHFASAECGTIEHTKFTDDLDLKLIHFATIGGIAVVHNKVLEHPTENEALLAAQAYQKAQQEKLALKDLEQATA